LSAQILRREPLQPLLELLVDRVPEVAGILVQGEAAQKCGRWARGCGSLSRAKRARDSAFEFVKMQLANERSRLDSNSTVLADHTQYRVRLMR
jgi:hypothetical protein